MAIAAAAREQGGASLAGLTQREVRVGCGSLGGARFRLREVSPIKLADFYLESLLDLCRPWR